MECILEAHPLPDILWYHVDTKLKNSDRIKMVRKSTSKYVHMLSLEIREPTIEDGGAYRCNAVNLYGESNANIALNFQGNSLSTTVHVLTIYIILKIATRYSVDVLTIMGLIIDLSLDVPRRQQG